MGSTLESLHRLQAIELQLATIRRTRGAKARQIEIYKRKAEQAEQDLQECKLRCREHQMKLDALSLDVASREDTIAQHRQALSKAKTNKEYAAILTAMNTEKADNAKLESELLQLMEAIQGCQETSDEIERVNSRLIEKVAGYEEALRTFDSQSKEGMQRLDEERTACASSIPPSAIASFNRVAERHDGEVMAAITKLSPKREDYICSGCNMSVTLEVINSLQTRDEIQTCGVCGRLLFLESQTAQS